MNRALLRRLAPVQVAIALAGCSSGHDETLPGNVQDTEPFSQIAPDEAIRVTGTEPFWGGDITDGVFTYSTPENIDGTAVPVERFAGRGGVSFSGTAEGGISVDLAVTPGECSDGMSDRTYPYTVTLNWGDDQRNGCGWSEAEPFTEVDY